MTRQEVTKLTNNPKTKQLIEWLDQQRKYTKMIMSPEFFHTTHTEKERVFLCKLIEEFFNCVVIRVGRDAVNITFN